jgi:hypothetical protein
MACVEMAGKKKSLPSRPACMKSLYLIFPDSFIMSKQIRIQSIWINYCYYYTDMKSLYKIQHLNRKAATNKTFNKKECMAD